MTADGAGVVPGRMVLGIGASGSSVAGLVRVLRALPLDRGLAVVLALQQREALDEAGLHAALGPVGDALGPVVAGERIMPGRIYLPAANTLVTLSAGRFAVAPAEGQPGERGTIDSLLLSLAEDQDGHAIALILGGTGGDGTLGIAALKEADGYTLAEETGTTGPEALASSNSPAALADAVLPLGALAERIATHVDYLASHPPEDAGVAAAEAGGVLAQIVTVLRERTGHDFHGYKRNTFLRRVQRRMQVTEAGTIADYLVHLRTRPDEPQQLFNDLLIGVTQFFRDTREFELLERRIVPELFAGKGRDNQVRVWVLGCSTGEEAYSLGILLREHASTLDNAPTIQIFASDIDGRALAAARVGRFPPSIAEHVRPDRLARWFTKEGNTFRVVKELREICVFSQHSVLRDAPFSRLDLVSCRNLLIYLDTELQAQVIPLFHFALRHGGILFLGNSENVSRHVKLFTPVDRGHRVFRRLDTATRTLADFPFTAPDRRPNRGDPPARSRVPTEGVARRAERIAERYTPAHAVVDEQFNVLHFSGSAGRFIHPARGAATLNLLALVQSDLRTDLQAALTRAVQEDRTVVMNGIPFGTEPPAWVDLAVEPVRDGAEKSRAFVVLFRDGRSFSGSALGDTSSGTEDRVQTLEAELAVVRERLQSTVEELESTNEELKSSNEEYQSLNEELQSANEELETSKEELQSMNEELTTVNGELAHRVQELGRANSDVKNLLESTQIATLFLDASLRVMNFTPALAEIFHLVETDIGRSIEHIKPRIDCPGLFDDVRRVIRSLATIDRRIEDPATGSRTMVRILPYRSVDNVIAGAVVTFTDMTPLTRAEAALRESEERFRLIVETARDYAIYLTDAEGRVTDWLPGAAEVFGWSAAEMLGQDCARLYTVDDRHSGVPDGELAEARRSGSAPDVGWHACKDGSLVFIEGMATPLHGPDGTLRGFLKIGQDVTVRRSAAQELHESRRQLRSLVEGMPQMVWRARSGGAWTWCSPQWTAFTGLSEVESLGQGWLAAVHPDDRIRVENAWVEAGTNRGLDVEIRLLHRDTGRNRWFSTRATPVQDEHGRPVEWLGTCTDIEDLRRLQDGQRVLVAELQHRTRNLVAIVRQLSERTIAGSTTLEAFRERFNDRLTALARVQGLLSRADEAGVTFDKLLNAELSAYAEDEGAQLGPSVVLEGPLGIGLRSATVQIFALALHELATNAAKYGALSGTAGRLTVRWAVQQAEAGERLRVVWLEEGVTMPAPGTAPPQGSGYGRDLIERALPYQLGAETEYVFEPDGIRCTIVMPLKGLDEKGGPNDG